MTALKPGETSRWPDSEGETSCERLGWSRLGTASLVLGPLSAALFGTAIALALVWKVGKDPNGHERVDAHKLVVGFSALAALVGFLVGIGLAIGGLFESRRARGPAIAGLALNALGALLVALLVIIGLMARR